MNPWEELGRANAPDGGTLVLCRRAEEFVIRIDGRELMSSRTHGSEDELGRRGVAELRAAPCPTVLVGGLGMGFTLRAVLDALTKGARVEVAELVPEVVAWNRGPLGTLADHPLRDPRVRVTEADVTPVMVASSARFDAILLDVDNGPSALTATSNAALYGASGLARVRRALRPGGTFALWSAAHDRAFRARLERAGFDVRSEHVPARGTKGRAHVVWVARQKA